MTKISAENRKPASAIGAAGLSLAALGVVFGDIGTSPLYTLKTVLNLTGPNPDAATTLGALSLILWTLFVVTTIKYVNFAMRIDNLSCQRLRGWSRLPQAFRRMYCLRQWSTCLRFLPSNLSALGKSGERSVR